MAIRAGNIVVGKKEEPNLVLPENLPNDKPTNNIKAGNIVVGKKEEPKKNLSKKRTNVKPSNKIKAGNIVVKNKPQQKIENKPVEKYSILKEGDLVMKINNKSDYLRDSLNLDQN